MRVLGTAHFALLISRREAPPAQRQQTRCLRVSADLGSPPGSEPGRGNGPASGDPALDPRRAAFGRAGPVQRARARAGRKEEAEAEEDPFRCSSSSVTARL
ncbi:unnamed protein product [Prorocentrum cordatum]|uniref:Uncharacterized protein n=1 Tax=Prorocentrum cordatum TaxID=2364126 RepID=A0ABN9W1N2_9DINO|nr:unnamed protein product [Polarella glacialis]